MYDPLWEEHPKVKKIREESEVKGLQRGIISLIKVRFPGLTDLAQKEVPQIHNPDVLNRLIEEIAGAPDETVARYILHPSAA